MGAFTKHGKQGQGVDAMNAWQMTADDAAGSAHQPGLPAEAGSVHAIQDPARRSLVARLLDGILDYVAAMLMEGTGRDERGLPSADPWAGVPAIYPRRWRIY
jgi:hypothetical protein